jgi:hypothetical protein
VRASLFSDIGCRIETGSNWVLRVSFLFIIRIYLSSCLAAGYLRFGLRSERNFKNHRWGWESAVSSFG